MQTQEHRDHRARWTMEKNNIGRYDDAAKVAHFRAKPETSAERAMDLQAN